HPYRRLPSRKCRTTQRGYAWNVVYHSEGWESLLDIPIFWSHVCSRFLLTTAAPIRPNKSAVRIDATRLISSFHAYGATHVAPTNARSFFSITTRVFTKTVKIIA